MACTPAIQDWAKPMTPWIPVDALKTTQYFQHVRKRPDRAMIRDEWINHVLDQPEKTEIQSDGRMRKWARIPEIGKFLRVILLEIRPNSTQCVF